MHIFKVKSDFEPRITSYNVCYTKLLRTFLVTAFAGEVGIPIVKFRAGWAGASEANFDKVMNIIKAMSPVGVLIDEADTLLGYGSKNNRSQNGSLFSRIADFMGNTAYRGSYNFV